MSCTECIVMPAEDGPFLAFAPQLRAVMNSKKALGGLRVELILVLLRDLAEGSKHLRGLWHCRRISWECAGARLWNWNGTAVGFPGGVPGPGCGTGIWLTPVRVHDVAGWSPGIFVCFFSLRKCLMSVVETAKTWFVTDYWFDDSRRVAAVLGQSAVPNHQP